MAGMKVLVGCGVLLVVLGFYLNSLVPSEIVEHRTRVVLLNSFIYIAETMVSLE